MVGRREGGEGVGRGRGAGRRRGGERGGGESGVADPLPQKQGGKESNPFLEQQV